MASASGPHNCSASSFICLTKQIALRTVLPSPSPTLRLPLPQTGTSKFPMLVRTGVPAGAERGTCSQSITRSFVLAFQQSCSRKRSLRPRRGAGAGGASSTPWMCSRSRWTNCWSMGRRQRAWRCQEHQTLLDLRGLLARRDGDRWRMTLAQDSNWIIFCEQLAALVLRTLEMKGRTKTCKDQRGCVPFLQNRAASARQFSSEEDHQKCSTLPAAVSSSTGCDTKDDQSHSD